MTDRPGGRGPTNVFLKRFGSQQRVAFPLLAARRAGKRGRKRALVIGRDTRPSEAVIGPEPRLSARPRPSVDLAGGAIPPLPRCGLRQDREEPARIRKKTG